MGHRSLECPTRTLPSGEGRGTMTSRLLLDRGARPRRSCLTRRRGLPPLARGEGKGGALICGGPLLRFTAILPRATGTGATLQ